MKIRENDWEGQVMEEEMQGQAEGRQEPPPSGVPVASLPVHKRAFLLLM